MSGINDVNNLLSRAKEAIASAKDKAELDAVQVKFIGRKGEITSILRGLKDLPEDERKTVGAEANKARGEIGAAVKSAIEKFKIVTVDSSFDPSLPGIKQRLGATHPLTQTMKPIIDIFQRTGFAMATGPDIADD